MKKLVLLIVVVAAAWYGYSWLAGGDITLKKIPQEIVEFVRSFSIDSLPGTEPDLVEKCTTASGEVYYGEIPAGVRCANLEQVKGSLTVVPTEVITSVNDPVRADQNQVVEPPPKSVPRPQAKSPVTTASCESVTRCAQMTSCDQAQRFANSCQTWNVYDTDRVTCMRRWCEEDYYEQGD